MEVNKKGIGLFLIIGFIGICSSIQATPEKSVVDMAFEIINSSPQIIKKQLNYLKKQLNKGILMHNII